MPTSHYGLTETFTENVTPYTGTEIKRVHRILDSQLPGIIQAIGQGVISYPDTTSFAVSAGSGLSVNIAAGSGVVRHSTHGGIYVEKTTITNLPSLTASSTLYIYVSIEDATNKTVETGLPLFIFDASSGLSNALLLASVTTSGSAVTSVTDLRGSLISLANAMTTLGDTLYGGASGLQTRLAGNTTTTPKVLRQVGNGTVSAAPAWTALPASEIANTPAGNIAATNVQTALNELDTEKQPLDSDLTALAGLTSAANKVPYFTGSGTAAVADFSAAGRALVDDADAATQRATLSAAGRSGSTYTQVYATADRTIAAYTPDDESAVYSSTPAALADAATLADLNALRVAYENLRAAHTDLLQAVTAIVDDLQTTGAVQ